MRYSEQNLKKFKRTYYHGFPKNYDSDLRLFEEFYLTTKLDYTFCYARRGGKVVSYKLKDDASIFNMKCATDEAAFRKYCIEHNLPIINKIDFLKENDWSALKIGGDREKEFLKKIIKNLGYDGFFNYEIDKDGLDFIHGLGSYRFVEKDLKSPSIALFDTGKLIKIEESPVEELVDINDEIDFVKQNASRAILNHQKDFDIDAFVSRMYSNTLVLDKDEIEDIYNNITHEDLYESLARNACAQEAIAQHFRDWL